MLVKYTNKHLITLKIINNKTFLVIQNKHIPHVFLINSTQNRLELLNFGKEKKIGVTIEDVLNENNDVKGTKVILLIPTIK